MQQPDLEIDTDRSRIDFALVHSWLATTYWSPDVPYERVVRAAENSAMVVGAYLGGVQVGYLRVVSDKTTFAWICDVFVDEVHRGKGVAKAMVQHALNDPEYGTLRRWVLGTRDAQHVYAPLGFEPLQHPERWMLRGQQKLG